MAVVDTDDVVHVVDIVGREIHINPWSCLPHPPTVAETKLASIGSRFLDLFRKLGTKFFISYAIKISFEKDFFILIFTMQSMNFLLLRPKTFGRVFRCASIS